MNIRKWLCGIARKNKWKTLKNLCQCDKYYPIPEPEPIPPVPPEPPPPEPQPTPPPQPEPPQPPPPPPKPERPDILVGTSCYELLEFTLVDIDWFLQGIYDAGGNCTEIFASYTWSKGLNWQPYVNVGTVIEPLYDYLKENSSYWQKLEYIMAGCAKRDLTLIIRLLDYCSVKKESYYEILVWHHSVQKKKAQEPGGPGWGGLYGDGPKPYYSAFMKHIIELAKMTKCKVLFHAINEADYKPSKKELAGWLLKFKNPTKMKDAIILKFHEWMADELRRLGSRLAIISTNLDYSQNKNWAINTGRAFEVHGCNSPEAMAEVLKLGYGFVPNGDGPDRRAKGRQGDKPEKREPSIEQAAVMGPMAKKAKWPYVCWFCRPIENPWPPVLRRAKFDVLKAMVKSML